MAPTSKNSAPTTTAKVDITFSMRPASLVSTTQVAPVIDDQLDLYWRVSQRADTPGETLPAEAALERIEAERE